MRVARTLDRYLTPNPELTAAALLHDSPEYAPPYVDLDATLTDRFGPEVPRVIRALETEHHALAQGHRPIAPTTDPPVVALSAADKMVSLATTIRNASTAPDPAAYWGSRRPFLVQLAYLATFHRQATGHIPQAMGETLGMLIAEATDAASATAPRGPTTRMEVRRPAPER